MAKTKVTAESQSIYVPVSVGILGSLNKEVKAKLEKELKNKFPNILKNYFDDTGAVTDEGELEYKENRNYDLQHVDNSSTKIDVDFKSFYFPSKKGKAEFGQFKNKEVELVVAANSNRIVSNFAKEYNFEFKEIKDPYTDENTTALFIDSLKDYLVEADPSKFTDVTIFPRNFNNKQEKHVGTTVIENVIFTADPKKRKTLLNMIRGKGSPEFIAETKKIFKEYKEKYKKHPRIGLYVDKFWEATKYDTAEHLFKILMSAQPEDLKTDLNDEELYTPLMFLLLRNKEIGSVIGNLHASWATEEATKAVIEELEKLNNIKEKEEEYKKLQKEVGELEKPENKRRAEDEKNWKIKEIKDKYKDGKRISDEDYKKIQDIQNDFKELKNKTQDSLVTKFALLKEELSEFKSDIKKIKDNDSSYMFKTYPITTIEKIKQETKPKSERSLHEIGYSLLNKNMTVILQMLTKPMHFKEKHDEKTKTLTVDLRDEVKKVFIDMYKENQEQAKKENRPSDFLDLKDYLTSSEAENINNVKTGNTDFLREFLENPTAKNYVNTEASDMDLPEFKEGGKGSVSPLAWEFASSPATLKQLYAIKSGQWTRTLSGGAPGYQIILPGGKGVGSAVKSDNQVIDELSSVIVYDIIKKLEDADLNLNITDPILKPATVSRSSDDFISLLTKYVESDKAVEGVSKHPYNIVFDQIEGFLKTSYDKSAIKDLLKPFETKLLKVLKEGDDKNLSIQDLVLEEKEEGTKLNKELKEHLQQYKKIMSDKSAKDVRRSLINLFNLYKDEDIPEDFLTTDLMLDEDTLINLDDETVEKYNKPTWSKKEEERLSAITDTILANKNTEIFNKYFKRGTNVYKALEGQPASVLETVLSEPDLTRMAVLLDRVGKNKDSKKIADIIFKNGKNREATLEMMRKGNPAKTYDFFNKRMKTLENIYKDPKLLKEEKQKVMSSYLIQSEIKLDSLRKDYNPDTSVSFLEKLVTSLEKEIKMLEAAKLLQELIQNNPTYFENLGGTEVDYFKNAQVEVNKIKSNIKNILKKIDKGDKELEGKIKKLVLEFKDPNNTSEVKEAIKKILQQYKEKDAEFEKTIQRLSGISKNLDKGIFPKTAVENPDEKIVSTKDRYAKIKKEVNEVIKTINMREGISEDGTLAKPSIYNPQYVDLEDLMKNISLDKIVDILDSVGVKESRGRYSVQIANIAARILMQEIFDKGGSKEHKENFIKNMNGAKEKGNLYYDMEVMLNQISGDLVTKDAISESDFKAIKSKSI